MRRTEILAAEKRASEQQAAALTQRLPALRAAANAERAKIVDPMARMQAEFLAREWGDDSLPFELQLRIAEQELQRLTSEIARLQEAIDAEAAEARRRAEEMNRQEQARRQTEQAKLEAFVSRFGNLPSDLSGTYRVNFGSIERTDRNNRDTVLVSLITEDELRRLVAEVDQSTDYQGVIPKRVRNKLAAQIGLQQMAESANWRPDSYSEVAKRVGPSVFVEALISEYRSAKGSRRNPLAHGRRSSVGRVNGRVLNSDEMADILDRGVSINGVDFSRFTVLRTPLTPQSLAQNDRPQQEVHWKPTGLWYGCNGEWLRFLEDDFNMASADSQRYSEQYFLYAIDVRTVFRRSELREGKPAVLRLTEKSAIEAFSRAYGESSHYAPNEQSDVRWPDVARVYGGIEICPYQWALRHSHVGWYYTWDVASGCVWDARAIYNYRLIAQKKGVGSDGTLWEIA